MSEILTPEQIAALVEAAKHGELPDPGTEQRSVRRSHRMRTVDFSRPTKFSAEQQRRISRATETFCLTAGTRLSSELRWPVEFELLNTVQLTWSAAQAQLASNSLSALVEVSPLNTRMLLCAERSFVLSCIEALLGGSPERPPRERRLSEIDWSLTNRLFETLAHQLSLVWHELAGVTLGVVEIGDHDSSQVASVSEPTFTLLIECRMAKQSFALAMLIPWVAVAPIERKISGRESKGERDPRAGEPIQRAMSAVPVVMRAEVAATELDVRDILALAPGSVIEFGARAKDGVTLFAENVELARAQPGANGPRRAVQVCGSHGDDL